MLRRSRQQEADFGPGPADHRVRLCIGRAEIVAERGLILEVEDVAERRPRDLEIEQAGVEPALRRLDLSVGAKRVSAGAERIEIARRSEERRVGKECVRTGRSRWSQ